MFETWHELLPRFERIGWKGFLIGFVDDYGSDQCPVPSVCVSGRCGRNCGSKGGEYGRAIMVPDFWCFFYFMMRYGCGAHRVNGHAGHAGHESAEAEHIDPVCGMRVAADQGYGKMHQGTQYRFCSRNCLDQFEADPDKYLKPSGSKTGGAS